MLGLVSRCTRANSTRALTKWTSLQRATVPVRVRTVETEKKPFSIGDMVKAKPVRKKSVPKLSPEEIMNSVVNLEKVIDDFGSVVTAEELEMLPPFDYIKELAQQVLKFDNQPALNLRLGKLIFNAYFSSIDQLSFATRLFTKAATDDPNSYEAFYWQGRTLELRGQLEPALKSYQQSMALHPDVETTVAIGLLYIKTDDYRQAIRYFLDAISQEPTSSAIMMNLGSAYLGYEKFDKAKQWLEMAFDKDPENFEIARIYAVVLNKVGETEASLDMLNAILNSPTHQANPLINEIHEMIGDVLASQEKFDEARQHYNEAIVQDPKNPSPYCKIGNLISLVSKDTDQSILWFEKAPNDVSAYNNLAAAYIGVGKEDEAISYLKKVLKMDPHNFETRMNYATLLNEREEPNEALKVLSGIKPKNEQEAKLLSHMLEIVYKTKSLSINPKDW